MSTKLADHDVRTVWRGLRGACAVAEDARSIGDDAQHWWAIQRIATIYEELRYRGTRPGPSIRKLLGELVYAADARHAEVIRRICNVATVVAAAADPECFGRRKGLKRSPMKCSSESTTRG